MHKDNLHLRLPAPLGGKADCYTPQLNSKAIPVKLDHIIPSDELTHDTKLVGGCKEMLQCTAMQMFGCKSREKYRLLTVSVANVRNWFIHADAGDQMCVTSSFYPAAKSGFLLLFDCPLVNLNYPVEYTRGLYSTIPFVTLQYKHSQ